MDALQALVKRLKSWSNVKLCRLLGSWMPSKLWLKWRPNFKLWRLLSSWMPLLSSWLEYHVSDLVSFRVAASTSDRVFCLSRRSQSGKGCLYDPLTPIKPKLLTTRRLEARKRVHSTGGALPELRSKCRVECCSGVQLRCSTETPSTEY